jgi:IS5 family transposase
MSDTGDFFRGRIDQMIDLRHPLAVLGARMPWQEIEAGLAQQFARRVREGQRVEAMDLFGPSTQLLGAGVSKAGRPRLPMRLMISLLYLKHAFDESDEGVVERWSETPLWQYFSGMDYYEHRPPCDPTALVKFRKLLGEAGVEELLAQTINAAVNLKLIDRRHLSAVIVDSTVQPKAVAYPTDSRLLETAREKLVELARDEGIALKQTYAKEGTYLRHKAGRYAHARHSFTTSRCPGLELGGYGCASERLDAVEQCVQRGRGRRFVACGDRLSGVGMQAGRDRQVSRLAEVQVPESA